MSLSIRFSAGISNTQRALARSSNELLDHSRRLGSGLRIERASDDAAGLGISERMRAQIRSHSAVERGIQDAVSLLQTAEGAVMGIVDRLHRMRELAVQAANGIYGDQDRAVMQQEYDEAYEDIQTLSATEFNGSRILEGTTFTVATGVNSGDTRTIVTPHATHPNVTIIEILGSSVSNPDDASAALLRIDNANKWLSSRLGVLGGNINTLQSAMESSRNHRTNLSAAESRMRDADVALESAGLTRASILQQGAVGLLAQANLSAQNVLQLLQP